MPSLQRIGDDVRINNCITDTGNRVRIGRDRGILQIGVEVPHYSRTGLKTGQITQYADIDLDDLRTALQMLGVDC